MTYVTGSHAFKSGFSIDRWAADIATNEHGRRVFVG